MRLPSISYIEKNISYGEITIRGGFVTYASSGSGITIPLHSVLPAVSNVVYKITTKRESGVRVCQRSL